MEDEFSFCIHHFLFVSLFVYLFFFFVCFIVCRFPYLPKLQLLHLFIKVTAFQRVTFRFKVKLKIITWTSLNKRQFLWKFTSSVTVQHTSHAFQYDAEFYISCKLSQLATNCLKCKNLFSEKRKIKGKRTLFQNVVGRHFYPACQASKMICVTKFYRKHGQILPNTEYAVKVYRRECNLSTLHKSDISNTCSLFKLRHS